MNTSDLGYLYLKSHLMGFATQINVVALYVLYSTYINDFFICFYKGVSMPSIIYTPTRKCFLFNDCVCVESVE